MGYTTGVGHTAVAEVTHFLLTFWPQTVAIHNVEDDPAFQTYDVDLLWTVLSKDDSLRTIPVEVKGDHYHQTGNFFFETTSNESKQTPGCFLYTKAEWLFYLFTEISRLYCLPMKEARPWFSHHQHQFPERRTSTPTKDGQAYITVGRLVPIHTAVAGISGILQFQKEENSWHQISN
jgi:hypothetical protein